MHDTFSHDEVVFTGDSKSCAKYAETSPANIIACFAKGRRVKRRYTLEHIGYGKREMNVKKHTKRKDRYSLIDAVMMRDVLKLRNELPVGTLVRVFKHNDTTDEDYEVGVFPITEKYRYVFSVGFRKHQESYTWVALYRKDGVEIAKT